MSRDKERWIRSGRRRSRMGGGRKGGKMGLIRPGPVLQHSCVLLRGRLVIDMGATNGRDSPRCPRVTKEERRASPECACARERERWRYGGPSRDAARGQPRASKGASQWEVVGGGEVAGWARPGQTPGKREGRGQGRGNWMNWITLSDRRAPTEGRDARALAIFFPLLHRPRHKFADEFH